MFSFRTVSAVSILGLLVTLAGCSGASETGSGAEATNTVRSQETAAAADAAAQNGGPRGPHGHGGPGAGPGGLLFAALQEPSVNLTDAQKTTIKSAIDANRPTPPAFDQTRAKTLADAVRSGKVDATQLTPPNANDAAAHQAAEAKAIATLHDTLSADQRQALVTAVKSHAADHKGKGGPGKGAPDGADGGPRGPHAGGPGGHGPHAGGPGGHGPGGFLHGMLEDLNLSQAQKDQIKAKLEADRPAKPTDAQIAEMKTKHEAMKAEMDKKLDTFVQASFDANAFVAKPAGATPPPNAGDHFAKELNDVLSVLDAAQREALAKKIEAGPPARK